jgi:hypothetical protein
VALVRRGRGSEEEEKRARRPQQAEE